MKRSIFILTIFCALASTFIGCSKPELKSVRGEVKSVEVGDSMLMSMTMLIDGQEKIVKLTDAQFQNGIALAGDSVILDYINGREDTLRGLVVTVLPKSVHYFEPSDTLIIKDNDESGDSIN